MKKTKRKKILLKILIILININIYNNLNDLYNIIFFSYHHNYIYKNENKYFFSDSRLRVNLTLRLLIIKYYNKKEKVFLSEINVIIIGAII